MNRVRCCVFLLALITPSIAYAETARQLPSYGWLLAKTILVLVGICALAFAGLRWLAKVQASASKGKMAVLAKLPMEPRRSIFVVKIGERGLIVGSSESGMQPLGELSPSELLAFEDEETAGPVLQPAEAT